VETDREIGLEPPARWSNEAGLYTIHSVTLRKTMDANGASNFQNCTQNSFHAVVPFPLGEAPRAFNIVGIQDVPADPGKTPRRTFPPERLVDDTRRNTPRRQAFPSHIFKRGVESDALASTKRSRATKLARCTCRATPYRTARR